MDKGKDRQDKREVEIKPPRGYTEEEWAREREEFRKWYFQEVKKYKEALQKGEISEEELRQRDREGMVVAYLQDMVHGLGIRKILEMIDRYNEDKDSLSDFERFVIEVNLKPRIRRLKDREAWEMFFPNEKFPERGL